MQPGDTFLAMALPMGGHLTHGTKVSFSGKWFNAVHYGVDRETEDIDYDQVAELAREHRPKVILRRRLARSRGSSTSSSSATSPTRSARSSGSTRRTSSVSSPARRSPARCPYADVVTFTTHKVLRGPRSGALVCKAEHAAALDRRSSR